MRSYQTARALVFLIGLVLLASGCSTSPRTLYPAVVDESGGSDFDAQITFWHTLGEKSVTTNNDAFHGLLLFADGEDSAETYEQRVARLKERQMLPRGFARPAGEAVRRGDLAIAVAKLSNIRGGVMMSVLPRNERYALRELVYQGLFPASSVNQTFSGTEFLGIIGKLEDYQRRSNVPAKKIDSATSPEQADDAGASLLA